MKNDEIEILRELVDELNFVRQFLTDDKNYTKIKELNKKINELETKLEDTKINIDKEYFENLKKDIEENKNKLISILNEEEKLFDSTKKIIKKEREYLINVLQEIRIENEKLRKKFNSVFSKVQLFAAVIIFIAAAAGGYYFGCHFLK